MTQAYPNDGQFDALYQPSHRSMSNQYYDRNTPYSHYRLHRRSHRPEYAGRHSTRTLIHDPEANGHNGQASRKRIGLACTRCRKRKIKCSGDVGDGSGCTACRAQGGDGVACTFNRVGSELIQEYEEYLTNNQPAASQDITYSLDPATSSMYGSPTYPSLDHRPSLPILQTRASYPENFESYNVSPVEGYGYPSYNVPRHDSLSSTYDNAYRPWSNSTMLPPASGSTTYEQSPGYSFDSISTPFFPAQQQQQHQSTRLPSVTSDTFSALNMGHLFTSLPTQTVQSRRLPIPHTTQAYDPIPCSGPELPEIRPLAEPRTRLSSTHSRIAASWAGDTRYSDSRNGSIGILAPANSLPLQPTQRASLMQEPMVGYQYTTDDVARGTITSPSGSPNAGPSSSAGYGGLPLHTMTPVSYGSHYGLPPITTSHRSGGISSRTADGPHTSSYGVTSNTTTASSSNQGGSSDPDSAVMSNNYTSYPTIKHPQPQHSANVAALLPRSSFDHEHQQHAPTQRISVSDLSNGEPSYSSS